MWQLPISCSTQSMSQTSYMLQVHTTYVMGIKTKVEKMMKGNQQIKLTHYEELVSRAIFAHLMCDGCCGVMICVGELRSEAGIGTYKETIGCLKCGEIVTLR